MIGIARRRRPLNNLSCDRIAADTPWSRMLNRSAEPDSEPAWVSPLHDLQWYAAITATRCQPEVPAASHSPSGEHRGTREQ